MIFKYLLGGTTEVPPLVSYEPVIYAGNSSAKVAASLATTKSDGLGDKDVLELLKNLQGLPSDTAVVSDMLLKFELEKDLGLDTTTNINSRYISLVHQISTMKYNKELYDKAKATTISRGTSGEYAIDPRGRLVCVNPETNDYEYLTVELFKNLSEYIPLTNLDIINLRAEHPELAFKNLYILVIDNSIGMPDITKMISDAISGLGTSEVSYEGFANTHKSTILQGLEDFKKAAQKSGNYNPTVHNLYKGSFLTSSQKDAAESALMYIYQTLPHNAKTLLKTKTNNGTDKEAVTLIGHLITSKTTYKEDFDLDLTKSATETQSGSEDAMSKAAATWLSEFQIGGGGHDVRMTIDVGGTAMGGVEMVGIGQGYEAVPNANNSEIIKNTSVRNMLDESKLIGVSNTDEGIYFGNLKITREDLKNIKYNDSEGIARVTLPINNNGDIDFKVLEAYLAAEKEFALSGNLSPQERRKIFSKVEGLSLLLLPNGEYDANKFRMFMVISGITSDDLVNIDENNQFIRKVDDSIKDEIEQALSYKSIDNKVRVPNVDAFGFTDYYKGNIFIPLNHNKNASQIYGKTSISLSVSDAYQEEYDKRNVPLVISVDPSNLKI